MGSGSAIIGGGYGMANPAAGDPANNRYVDATYTPIAAERLRQALTSDSPSTEDAFLVVAKRIPVRMGLVMDQRQVHRLIAECGNANLVVEVRQVRINRQKSAGGAGSGGMGGMGGMMGGMGPMGGMGVYGRHGRHVSHGWYDGHGRLRVRR